MKKEKMILAADHGGFELKDKIKKYLASIEFDVQDLSEAFDESDDYPDVCFKAAKKVVSQKAKGIFFCGTGIGMCICANKVKGVRAALAHDDLEARLSRQHNDANVLCLGGRVLDEKKASVIVRAWLSSSFLEGRHQRRLDKIKQFESS